jgi:hypothetical protein
MCVLNIAMELVDRLGRRRRPDQNRGLRPLFPKLQGGMESRVLRIAMTTPAWQRIGGLLAENASDTRPRAAGALIERLLAHFDATSRPWAIAIHSRQSQSPRIQEPAQSSNPDWQVWQIRKERALLPMAESELRN